MALVVPYRALIDADVASSSARRLAPWWVAVTLGAACVVVGGALIGRPFRSLSVLVVLTALAMVLVGVGELFWAGRSARRRPRLVVGVVFLAAAVLVLVWPGITVLALAVAAGLALVFHGITNVAEALFAGTDDRAVGALTGLSSVLVGAVALTWPSVTVLVLAAGFGLAMVVVGLRQILAGWRLRRTPDGDARRAGRWPTWVRVAAAGTGLVVALGLTAVSVVVHRAQPGEPGEFYSAPSPLPDEPPGALLRSEIVDGFQPGATTHRVLYLSTGFDGMPTAVSGLVIIPDAPAPAGGRKVVGYSHGTVGLASRCAPSTQGGDVWAEFMRSEGLSEFIDAGYVVAASDYQGLGTAGPHPYLVGASEGMNQLDAVRAARSMPQADASAEVGLWAHSQGGHASLFAGQLAASYAPELNIVGVAAGAPAPDLVEMFKENLDSPLGRILIAGALQAWSEVYDDASLDQIVTPAARPVVRELAENCLFSSLQVIGSVPASLALELSFISNPPWDTEPWATIVASNDPGQIPLETPVLLTQGADDLLVPPAVTAALLGRLCALGDTVRLHLMDDVAHIDGGPAAVPTVARWMADRFAGRPAPDDCA